MFVYLFETAAVALAAAFALLLLKKWGIIEWLQVHGNDFLSKMANCDFCLSWWTCLVVATVSAIMAQDPLYILTTVMATPLTRKLQ